LIFDLADLPNQNHYRQFCFPKKNGLAAGKKPEAYFLLWCKEPACACALLFVRESTSYSTVFLIVLESGLR
jgi:hypothetical protein